jgi:pectin methylesterase-like acyl-CoA thioesterase
MMKLWRAAGILTVTAAVMAGCLSATAGHAAAETAGIAFGTAPVVGTASGSRAACADTPLTITFPAPPTLGTAGSITVHNADGSVADSINLADPASFTETVGGATDAAGDPHHFHYYPVIITGDTATIYPHQELDYGHTYYVTVDPGVFTGFGGISSPWSWRFSTRPAPPRPGTRVITVDSHGHADFCTVQGAIDAIPAGNTASNTAPRLIRVADGTYTELDWVAPDKPNITVQGQSRAGTVIQYANNDTFNAEPATDVCARQALPGHDNNNCWRSNFSVEANDFTLEDLTLLNTTPHGGSQAEAFRGNADRITLNRVNLLSYQDTIRLQGRAYVTNSYIQGDVDFTWGVGTVFWTHDEFKSMNAGYVTQIRNGDGQNGYVFYDDVLTRAPGVADGSVYLGRIDPTVYPHSQAVYIDTKMDAHINPAGWLLNNADCSAGTHLQFWEYGSVNLEGQPVDTSERLPCSRQLTAAEAAQWSDPAFVLSGWVPATVCGDFGTEPAARD